MKLKSIKLVSVPQDRISDVLQENGKEDKTVRAWDLFSTIINTDGGNIPNSWTLCILIFYNGLCLMM